MLSLFLAFGIAAASTSCKHRLQSYGKHHSACVIIQGGQALLVWVPYGSRPGWDFPGGQRHHGEAACETAERETCEETGHRVRAVKKLSYNVFECEIVQRNACWEPVDEGFLEKKWVKAQDVPHLQYRGGTWGDKKGFLKNALSAVSAESVVASSQAVNIGARNKDLARVDSLLSGGLSRNKSMRKLMKFNGSRQKKAKQLKRLRKRCPAADDEEDRRRMSRAEAGTVEASADELKKTIRKRGSRDKSDSEGSLEIGGVEFRFSEMKKQDLHELLEIQANEIFDIKSAIKEVRKRKRNNECA